MSEVLNLYLLPLLASISFIAVVILVSLSMRNKGLFSNIFSKSKGHAPELTSTANEAFDQSDTQLENKGIENVDEIKQELKILQVEREIVGYALTHLYEAEAEGKIVEKDRLRLVDRYKTEMHRLNNVIEKKQMIIRLHDLEKTRSTLVEMFHSKIDEISNNIEMMKTRLGIPSSTQISPKGVIPPSSTRAENTSQQNGDLGQEVKSEAQEKLEAVQEEVLKILERLEQIETEG
ncbi:MAG: hypothetical protein JSV76_06495 [Candidatus Bathyarchaeota archaeon]|nr:MAG: hypothetical protein JSV76_06495 [Candidatus Bathyarchaeota archaeon]